MAVVAGGGAIGVTVHATVRVVGLCLLVCRLRVAVDAGEAGEIRRNLMAVVAHRAMMRNTEKSRVIECCAEPAGGVVAARGIASGRETRGDVIGHGTAQCLRALPGG